MALSTKILSNKRIIITNFEVIKKRYFFFKTKKMKSKIIGSILFFLCLANLGNAKLEVKAVNGGRNCATCTTFVGLTERLTIVYNQSIENSLDKLCGFLPQGIFRTACLQAVSAFGTVIIDG